MAHRRLTPALLALALAVAACSDRASLTSNVDTPDDEPEVARVASVSVNLGSPTIRVDEATPATAEVRAVTGDLATTRVVWRSSDTTVATVSANGLVTGVAVGSVTITATAGYHNTRSGSATLNVIAPAGPPGGVTDLRASTTGANTVTLSFTQVDDGTGAPAKYNVRYAADRMSWGSASSVTGGTCATPLAGTSTSEALTCTVTGLSAATAYDFQLVAYRGMWNTTDVTLGPLSNVAEATTSPSTNSEGSTPTSVSVTPSTTTLAPGGSQQLAADLRDQFAASMPCSAYSWTSQQGTVATVSPSGLVSAVAAGIATITATCSGASGTATITVTSPAPAPAPVASVTVTLGSPTLQVGQTTQATASVSDVTGNTASPTITWKSSNTAAAEVSSSGLVTAVAAGSATISASVISNVGTTSGSASLTVTASSPSSPPQPPAPTPTVTTVSVSPASASVLVGDTQALSATVKDQNGAAMTGQSVSWASSNSAVASVNASGVVTGVAAGSATITATSSGKSGSAAISVTAPVPPPAAPPPPAPTGGSVEPAGMTVITERGWNSLGEGGWYDQLEDGANLASKYRIVQDPTAPKSPSNVGMQIFPVGFSLSGVSPAVAEKGLGNRGTVYVAFWVKVSSNWVGHPSGVLKTLHFWTGGTNKLIPEITGSGSGTLQPTIAIQNTVTSGSHLYMPNLVPSATFTRGVWHKMEYIMTGNTSDANGRVEWWMDGVKVGDVSGLQFNSGSATWELIQVNPTYGGNESGSLAVEQFIWFDHLYVSGK